MTIRELPKNPSPLFLLIFLGAMLLPGQAPAQEAPTPPMSSVGSAASQGDLAAAAQLTGRTIEEVKILGNTQVSPAVILELVRSRVGDKFDPATAVADYERIYDRLKLFANVEALVQPTRTGVIVIFRVTEQRQIRDIRFRGNADIKTAKLMDAIDLKKGEAIDSYRINLARQSIEKLYRDKNFPFAHVNFSQEELAHSGVLLFEIVEGPRVRVRKVDFIGNNSFSAWRLKDQVKTGYYIFVFRAGTFDPEQVDDDVSSLSRFYQDRGYFDVRVGRKLTRSADMKEMQVTFVIDEGMRYTIDHVEFRGLTAIKESTLRKNMFLLEGKPYDKDGVDRDTRAIVRAYSKVGGFIYQEPSAGIPPDPQYLQITTRTVFKRQPGKLDLIYDISEGKQFRLGQIIARGNTKTQDKVILRELRMRPGQVYDSAAVADAQDRLRGLPYFSSVTIMPVGDDPNFRDLLVEVQEGHTANISAGVGINSNGGLGANLSYEQKNFDITNLPTSFDNVFNGEAFTGAGQDLLLSFQPGTLQTNATVRFTEPYLFDQPYSLSTEGYYIQRERDVYNDQRVGGRIALGQQFNYVYSGSVYLRAEDVDINSLILPTIDRAPEIVAGIGHHTLTSAGFNFTRDTTNHGPITYEGNLASAGVEQGNALGGTVNFTRLSASMNDYKTVSEDLLARRSVFNTHFDFGWDPVKAPFYERFYGGGFGSVRGFQFREISPRAGPYGDTVGGDFSLTGGAEYQYPLAENFLRGVLFFDAGDVESNMHFGTIRTAVGFGFRLTVGFLGNTPLALDFGFPLSQNPQDRTQLLSFSLGISR